MSQLQSPAPTPFRNRKRVHSGTPPGTPPEIEDEVTAVDEVSEDSNSDDSDEEGEIEEAEPDENSGEVLPDSALVGPGDISTIRCNRTGRRWWLKLDEEYKNLAGQFRETIIPGRMFYMFLMMRIDTDQYSRILETKQLTELEFDRKMAKIVEGVCRPPGRVGVSYAKNIWNPSQIQIRLPYVIINNSKAMQPIIEAVNRAFSEEFCEIPGLIDTGVYKNEIGLCMLGSEEEEGSGVFQEINLETGLFQPPTEPAGVVLFTRMYDALTIPDAPRFSKEPVPLEEFLRPYAVDKTEFISHTSMTGKPWPGKWNIPIEENGRFLSVLHHHLIVRKLPAYISERVEKGRAYNFFMDFDFDMDMLNSSGLLNEGECSFFKFVNDVVLRAVYDTEVGRQWCKSSLILSSKPGHPNKIHINGEFVCQERSLAPSIMHEVGQFFMECFPDIDWKKAFDLAPYSNGLRMLGCTKEGDIPYQVYNIKTGMFEPTNLGIICRTSLRSHLVSFGGDDGCGGGGTVSVDPETEMAVKEFVNHLKSSKAFGNQPLNVNNVRLSSGRFINVTLSDSRCPYIGREHKRSSPMFLFITKQGVWLKCWDTDSCGEGRQKADLTEAMKEVMGQFPDDEQVVEQGETAADWEYFPDPQMNEMFIRSFSGTDHDVAEFAVFLVRDEFASVDSKNNEASWYQFRNGRWFNKDASTNLFAKLDKLPSIYKAAASDSSCPKLQKTIQNVQRNVSDLNFLKKLIIRMNNMLRDGDLENRLDSNYHLLGFNDGVYDFHEMRFRQAVKTDYVSMTVGYDFPHESDPVYRAKLLQFLEEIQPDPVQRMYSLKADASCLNAEVPYELFFTMSGNLRNGKTVKNDLMMATLGAKEYLGECKYTYASQFSTDFLCKDRKDSDPSPELLEFRHARLLVCTEPDPGVKIRTGTLKRAIGRETWAGRFLHSNRRFHFKIRALLAILVNDLPELSSHEPAVWEKMRRIDYPTKFVDNPTLPHEKLINRPLKKEVVADVGWRKEMMTLLLEIYRDELIPNGLEPAPECVMASTAEYREEANPLIEWWQDRTEEADTHVSTKALLADFVCHPTGDSRISSKTFCKRLRQELGLVIKPVRYDGGSNSAPGVEFRRLKGYGEMPAPVI